MGWRRCTPRLLLPLIAALLAHATLWLLPVAAEEANSAPAGSIPLREAALACFDRGAGEGSALDLRRVRRNTLRVRLCADATERSDGDYVALNVELAYSNSFPALHYVSTQPDGEFEFDLSGFSAGQQLFVMYFSAVNDWARKAHVELLVPPDDDTREQRDFYGYDHSTVLRNPGTGFTYLNKSFTKNYSPPYIPENTREDVTIIWWNIAMNNNEQESDELPLTLLANLRDTLTAFVARGKQVVIRFYYTGEGEVAPVPQSEPDLRRIGRHQEQLASVIRQRREAVAGINAGMLGDYGEWHNSRFGEINSIEFGQSPADLTSEQRATYLAYKAVLDNWLELFPDAADPPIQVRRHMQKLLLSNSTVSHRVHHHLDCALASASDVGSFPGPETSQVVYDGITYTIQGMAERNSLAAELDTTMLGETCFFSDRSQARLGCEAPLTEFARHHWVALNINWYEEFIKSWRDGGCFDKIHAQLGSRWHVQELAWSPSHLASLVRYLSPIVRLPSIELEVANNGWSISPVAKVFRLAIVLPPTAEHSEPRELFSARLDESAGWRPSSSWLPRDPVRMTIGPIQFHRQPAFDNRTLREALFADETSYNLRLELQVIEPSCVESQLCPSSNLATRLANAPDSSATFDAVRGVNVLDTQSLAVVFEQAPPSAAPSASPTSTPTRSPSDPTTVPTDSPTESTCDGSSGRPCHSSNDSSHLASPLSLAVLACFLRHQH